MDRTVIWVGIKSEHKITRKILLGKIILFTIIYSLVEKKLLCLDGYNTKLTEIEILISIWNLHLIPTMIQLQYNSYEVCSINLCKLF